MLNMDVVATFNEQPNHHQTNFIVFVAQMKSQSFICFNSEKKWEEKRASNKGLLKKRTNIANDYAQKPVSSSFFFTFFFLWYNQHVLGITSDASQCIWFLSWQSMSLWWWWRWLAMPLWHRLWFGLINKLTFMKFHQHQLASNLLYLWCVCKWVSIFSCSSTFPWSAFATSTQRVYVKFARNFLFGNFTNNLVSFLQ